MCTHKIYILFIYGNNINPFNWNINYCSKKGTEIYICGVITFIAHIWLCKITICVCFRNSKELFYNQTKYKSKNTGINQVFYLHNGEHIFQCYYGDVMQSTSLLPKYVFFSIHTHSFFFLFCIIFYYESRQIIFILNGKIRFHNKRVCLLFVLTS